MVSKGHWSAVSRVFFVGYLIDSGCTKPQFGCTYSFLNLFPILGKYDLHNDFQEILEICTSSCTLCPSIMRPKQRLISGQLHVMGKLHIKFQENRARNVLSVKNRNTYVMKFSFFEKNIFCLKSYRSAAWQDILHKKENQSLDLSFF